MDETVPWDSDHQFLKLSIEKTNIIRNWYDEKYDTQEKVIKTQLIDKGFEFKEEGK